MFPSGDPLLIHHYFHGYLAGFTVRPGSLESREVIECLYACREGLDYSDFDSLGKGMKVCPSAQLAWVSSTLLPGLASQDFACSPTSDSSPPFSFVSLIAWVLGICQGILSIFFLSASRFMWTPLSPCSPWRVMMWKPSTMQSSMWLTWIHCALLPLESGHSGSPLLSSEWIKQYPWLGSARGLHLFWLKLNLTLYLNSKWWSWNGKSLSGNNY